MILNMGLTHLGITLIKYMYTRRKYCIQVNALVIGYNLEGSKPK